MKNILVLTHRSQDVALMSKAVSATSTLIHAADLETARALHSRTPFDLIMADIVILEAAAEPQSEFVFSEHPFVAANPFVQFVVLCPRENAHMGIASVEQGAAGYLLYPVEEKELELLLASVTRALSRDFELEFLRDRFWKTEWLDVIRSSTPGMRRVYDSIKAVAPTIATILILGETGTGKGMMARLIHRHSQRCEKPFISVHCGAIPDTLIESELFGHDKGAFTGADRRKPGKFEMARGGTIFLDEIGTISPPAQIKLLQVLQDGTFSRLGSSTAMEADVRIIAATNADLAALVDQGSFRKDLYYRLNVFPIELPPLRERLEDLPALAEQFITNLNVKYGKEIRQAHPAVLEGFRTYDWPGNIRELENLIERAYILETGTALMPHNFPVETMLNFESDTICGQAGATLAQARKRAVDQFEYAYLTALLEQTRGRINRAAQKAGVTPRQLNRLLTRHNLDKNTFKSK
ncbi:MAG TPA: Fis family transcriptional regulator [Desulfobacteraceae bacterium]|nr:Fis family transcriptional regulator [Desulfobacteraceae bacterium]